MKFTFLYLLTFLGLNLFAADTTRIKTDVQCGQCKDRLETRLGYIKGVQSTVVDIDNDLITVIYDPKLVSKDKLEAAVTKIGYDANGKKAVPAAIKKLPACCRPGGHN